MFEDLTDKNALSEFTGAVLYLVKANPALTAIYAGVIPLATLWIIRDSFATAFALQVYLITAFVFIDNPLRNQKQRAKSWFFWKRMLLVGAIIHPLLLAGIWYADLTFPSFTVGGASLILLVFICGAVELVVVNSLVDRFWPPPNV